MVHHLSTHANHNQGVKPGSKLFPQKAINPARQQESVYPHGLCASTKENLKERGVRVRVRGFVVNSFNLHLT